MVILKKTQVVQLEKYANAHKRTAMSARLLAASRNTCTDMIAAFDITEYMKVSVEFKDTFTALGGVDRKCQVCGNHQVTAWFLGCPCHPCCDACHHDESLIATRGGKCCVRNCNELIVKPVRKLTALTKATEQVKVVQEKMIHAMQVEESRDREGGAERRREAVDEAADEAVDEARPRNKRRLSEMSEEEAEEVREARRAAKRVREEKKFKIDNYDDLKAQNDALVTTLAEYEAKIDDLTGGDRDQVLPKRAILFMDMHDSAEDSTGILVSLADVPEKVCNVLKEAEDPWDIVMEEDDMSNFEEMAEAAYTARRESGQTNRMSTVEGGHESDDEADHEEEDEDEVVAEWTDAVWQFFDTNPHQFELPKGANVTVVYKVKRFY